MTTLDLGCGDRPEHWQPDSDGIDMFDYGQKYVLNLCDTPWPIPGDMYTKVVAQHIMEHITKPEHFINILNEIWRVGKGGAEFYMVCPHWTSPNQFRDPFHTRMISEYSLDMFLEDSPIHFGHGYDIRATFKKNAGGIFVDANRDVHFNLEIVK